MTPIWVFDKNPTFEWEGKYNNEIVRVIEPRHGHGGNRKIIGQLPEGYDILQQLEDELKRVLWQLG